MKKISTIGYEASTIDGVISSLKLNDISTLIDVRAVALSRKKGFSKTALRERLASEGIGYVHLSALGDPKPGRDAARAGKMAEFKRIYRDHLKNSEAQEALVQLAEISSTKNCCLLCFERDPAVCHRSIVTEKLRGFGFKTIDLFTDTPGVNERKSPKLRSGHSHQGVAAT